MTRFAKHDCVTYRASHHAPAILMAVVRSTTSRTVVTMPGDRVASVATSALKMAGL